ncbi:hypothetical protein [Leptospira kanakyensis]|uniref:SH3 domain-containing protein n=1 Tax=Leptospira kanakyensis TaxID=2484968 RepID=A0A6N4Q0J6_9LEPT|nr:hypothetical protein [Leptospira kanakyensis]MCW7469620.1 hypothetical protein [Leptospira kanakyensis]TGK50782.1 hypothetical protein EHQ11_14030 [Leptospira kanakyensis]TGK63617.1 hypothetical protein EHQ16_03990 [Leptospira kanakyensis]TGK69919.1 hypothetical protein EHQ18_14190 [Leptospira kanakyensis]
MKQRFQFLSLFLILLSSQVLAQLKPEIENEWIRSKSLGPVIDKSAVRWNFIAEIKVDNLESIHGYEVKWPEKTKHISETNQIKQGDLILSSEPLLEKEYLWIYELGTTSLFFTFEITNSKGEKKVLNVPINFSEKSKETLRLFMEKNLNIKKETVKVPFLRNLDGRRWYVGNSGEDNEQVLIEMIPEGTKIETWTEIYRLNLLKSIGTSNRPAFMNAVKNGLSENCPSLIFNTITESPNEIIYEWSHDGCNGWPASTEITRMISGPSNSTMFTFANKNGKISKLLREIYLTILEKEK